MFWMLLLVLAMRYGPTVVTIATSNWLRDLVNWLPNPF